MCDILRNKAGTWTLGNFWRLKRVNPWYNIQFATTYILTHPQNVRCIKVWLYIKKYVVKQLYQHSEFSQLVMSLGLIEIICYLLVFFLFNFSKDDFDLTKCFFCVSLVGPLLDDRMKRGKSKALKHLPLYLLFCLFVFVCLLQATGHSFQCRKLVIYYWKLPILLPNQSY